MTGIDLPVTDMVFMNWSDSSITRNDQRAGRCLRLHGDKQYAVVAVWAQAENITGLLELAYGAQQLKAVTRCIEDTDGEVEATVSNSFRAAVERQMQVDLTAVDYDYAAWARLCSEYTHLAGRAVERKAVHGGRAIGQWVNRQQAAFRNGILSEARINLCRKVGIVLEKTRTQASSLNDDEKVQFLSYCQDNSLSFNDRYLKVQWQDAERSPYSTLCNIKKKWDKLSSVVQQQLENMGFREPVSNKQQWLNSFEAWKSLEQNGTLSTKSDTKEYKWQYQQRLQYSNKSEYMTQERIAMLEAAGFKWEE